ncbi:MAG: hypothetical protein Tsb002_07400 [Wenzhouxiangellaceae bacterium]
MTDSPRKWITAYAGLTWTDICRQSCPSQGPVTIGGNLKLGGSLREPPQESILIQAHSDLGQSFFGPKTGRLLY